MQKKHKVLIMDRGGLRDLDRQLDGLGVDLIWVGQMEESLGNAQDFDAAILLLEGGREDALLAALQAQRLGERVPVLVVTEQPVSETVLLELYRAGAVDVLARRVADEVLAGKLKACLAPIGGTPATGDVLFQWLSQSMEHIAQAMASSPNIAEVPGLVLEQLSTVMPYERGSILLREGEILWIVAQRGFPEGWPAEAARIAIRPGDIFQQIVKSREALLIDDVTQTSAWHQEEGLPLHHSWLGVPLLSKDQVIGMVSLTRKAVGAFAPREVSLLRALASQAAVALVNAGLLNDLKRFNEHLEQLVQQRTDELNTAYARLKKLDEAKTSFLSIAAHELRTPLTLIAGYTSLLSSLVGDQREAAVLVRGISNGEKRLRDVVNDMTDVSRIDNQGLAPRKSPVSIRASLQVLRGEFETALRERSIQLIDQGLEHLPEIQADPDLILKLFSQLTGNAIKFTPNGGTVTVSGRSGVEDGAAVVEVLFRDTGIGIDPADHEVIFEKFIQMGPLLQHSSGKTKFKGGGPGLGLAIARGIVTAHGGRIWVESPGYDEERMPGSTFHVVLPVGGSEV